MKEQMRDEFRPAFLEDFVRDLRYGMRVLRRAKAFAAVAIITLGLGIAATAVFSVVDGILLRPLPYPEPDRIVRLLQIDATDVATTTYPNPTSRIGRTARTAFRQ